MMVAQALVLAPGQRVLACHSLAPDRAEMVVAPGLTLATIAEKALPSVALRRHALCFIDDILVPADHWSRVRPKPHCIVIFRVVPRGGGGGSGKNPLRTLLTIAVIVAASAVGAYLGPIVAAEFGIASKLGASIISGALGGLTPLAGPPLLNALMPPRRA